MRASSVRYYQHSRQSYAQSVPPGEGVADELEIEVNFEGRPHPGEPAGEFGIQWMHTKPGGSVYGVRVHVFTSAWAAFMASGVPEVLAQLDGTTTGRADGNWPRIDAFMDALEAAGIKDKSHSPRTQPY